MKKFYGYHLPHGTLFLYGKTLNECIPYIDNCIDSVEDICKYCSMHNLHIFYKPNHSIYGLIEYIRVSNLANKYSVRSTRKEASLFHPLLLH